VRSGHVLPAAIWSLAAIAAVVIAPQAVHPVHPAHPAHARARALAAPVITGVKVGLPYQGPARTGRRVDSGDTWYSTWAADGNIYVTSDDTHGYHGQCASRANLAVNELTGDDPSQLASPYTNCMSSYGDGGSRGQCTAGSRTCYNDGRTWKSEGIIAVGGTLYLAVTRQVDSPPGDYPRGYQPSDDTSLVKSANDGRTWSNGFGTADSPGGAAPPALSARGTTPGARSMFPAGFTTPQFINYGRDDDAASTADGGSRYVYAVSGDGYAYDGSDMILGRVPRNKISNLKSANWQFYAGPAGGSGTSSADWVGYAQLNRATRLITAPHQLSEASVQYVPALGQYVLTSFYYPFNAQWPGQGQNASTTWSFYSAPHPWGPWQRFFSAPTELCYVTCQAEGDDALGLYDPALVSKFSTEDGLGAVLFTSGDWSDRYRPGDDLYQLHAFPLTLATATRQVVDDSVAGTYSGNWTIDGDAPGFSDETDHVSDTCAGHPAAVSYRFTGTSIAWVGSTRDNHGIARVTVDGGAPTSVSTYSRTWRKEQVLYTARGLAPSPHTITIQVTCARSPRSAGTYQDVDAFIVGS
jgi:hypothetical protein